MWKIFCSLKYPKNSQNGIYGKIPGLFCFITYLESKMHLVGLLQSSYFYLPLQH